MDLVAASQQPRGWWDAQRAAQAAYEWRPGRPLRRGRLRACVRARVQGGGFKELDETEVEEARRRRKQFEDTDV